MTTNFELVFVQHVATAQGVTLYQGRIAKVVAGGHLMLDMDASETNALAIQAQLLRAMSPTRKLELMSAHSRMILSLAYADIRSQHPEWSERHIRIEASKRWLPTDLHSAAFGSEELEWTR